ncbi:MAG: DMT family transporter [Verrucomicrobiales bacterium]|nr:DMT family transporter [Verrucomicrobiales bacterium]
METEKSSERQGILLMLASIVFFAVNVLMLRGIALRAPMADGYVSSVYRGWIGLLTVWIAFRGRGFEPRHLITRPVLLLRGGVGAAGILLFYLTIEHLGAGRATIINLTYPIFGAVMAAAWLKERLVPRQMVWMLAALGGLMVFLADGALEARLSRHELLAALGAVVAGLAVVLIRVLGRTEHTSTIYASQCVWTIVVAWPACMDRVFEIPVAAAAGLVIAALMVTAGQLALTHAFRHLSVAKGSALQMLLPLVIGVGGFVLFNERFTGMELVGAAFTLFATWRVMQARMRTDGVQSASAMAVERAPAPSPAARPGTLVAEPRTPTVSG